MPVRASEAHALAAIVSGRLRVTTPDGATAVLEYLRHVEHADGHWSWIGRHPDVPDQHAIVTFGPGAVSGSIPGGRGLAPLRLAMADGVAWAGMDAAGGADPAAFPVVAVPAGASPDPAVSASAAPAGVDATAADAHRPSRPDDGGAIRTIDVLVAYTGGFAAARGGPSAALARIHHFVDSANQALADSGVGVRLRLVHAMPVAYPDATGDRAALVALTGGGSSIAPGLPGLRALHAARDRSGADLVMLVRKASAAGKGGCGIAWQLDGSSPPDADAAAFGASVVADGAFDTAGRWVACGEDAFAQALHHNLGIRRDDGGRLRGDARTLGAVAAFRATASVAALPEGDVDGNGTSDLSWFRAGSLEIWMMHGSTVESQAAYTPVTPLVPYVGGEFNDVPGSDIAWRDHYWDGVVTFWWGGPTYTQPYYQYTMSWGWRLQAAGDRNGDGISDMYWRSAVDGRLMYWEMSPSPPVRRAVRAFPQSLDADLLMSGDFNGDGLTDLLFRTRKTGATETWFPTGDDYAVVPGAAMSKYWRPAGAADFDGDGDDDMVWRSALDHRVVVWVMEGGERAGLAVFSSDADRQLLWVADLNGDRHLDLVWRRADGTVSAWLNTGGAFQHRYVGFRDTSWSLFTGGR
ncbi:hypothetical protein GCM10028862_18280 [Luteimonas pelagia]